MLSSQSLAPKQQHASLTPYVSWKKGSVGVGIAFTIVNQEGLILKQENGCLQNWDLNSCKLQEIRDALYPASNMDLSLQTLIQSEKRIHGLQEKWSWKVQPWINDINFFLHLVQLVGIATRNNSIMFDTQ
ncbi:hypothetical protein J1N35_022579, partial [Gossypium stocksii]